MKKYLTWKLLAILIVTLGLLFFDLPAGTQQKILPLTPDFIAKTKINLGLDLQGGSQLDYKIDLRKVIETDRENIVNGVQEVIERRVNRLGVAEPNIYKSAIGEETHIIVELAEIGVIEQQDVDQYLGEKKNLADLTDDEKKIVSLEKAKATVGKTIQLEFKEEKGTLDPQEEDKVRTNADAALKKIENGADYSVTGQEESQAYPGKVKFNKSEYVFESDVSENLRQTLASLKIDQFAHNLVEVGGSYVINENGETVEDKGVSIIRLVDEKEEIKTPKSVSVSHILIAWTGLESSDATVTRTEDEAYKLAKEIKQKLESGASFAELAKEYSNDSSNKDIGGTLSKPVTGDGTYVYDFEQASLALKKNGEISGITKTEFGYHIIKADDIKTDVKEKQYKYEEIRYSLVPDPWKETGLTGKHFVRADVQLDKLFQPYVSITFNDEGAKLFEEITGKNTGKRLAIFVGGDFISAPRVQERIAGGNAQITGDFTNEEAQGLARDLNTGAIPAPIVLSGEYTLGASLGKEALNKSLWAGFIGMLLVIIFMTAFYRLAGLVASCALITYGAILIFLIKAQLPLGVALLISLIIFGFIVMKIINSHENGWEKFLSFLLACVGFFFVTFLIKTGVVLTLAGIAGIIMSLGMAVDANVLIFERMKEELREGKTLTSAIDAGFSRAWSAIRDSNFSTLITCAVLFYFGSSIIKGFAFNLTAGVLVSMFTAITITRTLLYGFVGKKIAENLKTFGVTDKKPKNIDYIGKTKIWATISGSAFGIAVVAIIIFGLKLGFDFTGGTLLEFKFSEPIAKETLADTLTKIGDEINNENLDKTTPAKITEETTEETAEENQPLAEPISKDEISLSTDELSKIDFSGMQIISTNENGYIIKTKYMSSQIHDQLIAKLKDKVPNFIEPRFATVGPVIGETMLHKAIIAIIFTLIMIILYLAFAFRKIPKEVNPWRFGVCAIVALIHDVTIITGLYVILGRFLNVEIDALFITAMLTVFGYSVNDTIVVFDRLREKLIHDSDDSLTVKANQALNETMARSINTTLTTLLAIFAVLVLGSPSIFYFLLALFFGIAIGTYSSIFVATPMLVWWNKKT